MNFQARLIQTLIHINERIIFDPKLRAFYLDKLMAPVRKDTNKKLNIIDVGSNKGQTVRFFLKIDKESQIYGFEPNVKLFKKLHAKYANYSSVIISNKGLSSKTGRLLFQENIMHETSTFEALNYESEFLKRKTKILGVSSPEKIIIDKYEVDVITLQSFLHEHPDTFFDILKIDVEGHEYDCLLGLFSEPMARYPVRFIQMEEHKDDMYMKSNNKEIAELLIKNGFKKVESIKHGFGNFYEVIYENIRLQ